MDTVKCNVKNEDYLIAEYGAISKNSSITFEVDYTFKADWDDSEKADLSNDRDDWDSPNLSHDRDDWDSPDLNDSGPAKTSMASVWAGLFDCYFF